MDLNDYQQAALRTRTYQTDYLPGLAYAALGLAGEAGEVANEVKRMAHTDVDLAKVVAELGDTLWYVATMATELGLPLETIATVNLRKLQERHGTTQAPQRNQPL